MLQTDIYRLGEWAVENEMKINLGKIEVDSFTKAQVKERIRSYLLGSINPGKYLSIFRN
jgi:hypothetical protein